MYQLVTHFGLSSLKKIAQVSRRSSVSIATQIVQRRAEFYKSVLQAGLPEANTWQEVIVGARENVVPASL